MKKDLKKLTRAAFLACLALALSYLEAILPSIPGVPGVKLGIANIVIVFAMYNLGNKYAVSINLVRILLAAMMFGTVISCFYALCGGLLSFAVMAVLKKTNRFSKVGVSMAGGFFHNVGQLSAAVGVMGTTDVLFYFPVLGFSGIFTGILNGVILTLVTAKLNIAKP